MIPISFGSVRNLSFLKKERIYLWCWKLCKSHLGGYNLRTQICEERVIVLGGCYCLIVWVKWCSSFGSSINFFQQILFLLWIANIYLSVNNVKFAFWLITATVLIEWNAENWRLICIYMYHEHVPITYVCIINVKCVSEIPKANAHIIRHMTEIIKHHVLRTQMQKWCFFLQNFIFSCFCCCCCFLTANW